ncbi:hypothetical protein DM01DRAFT_1368439 [Hesseltinella vesiculosa]|uniref:88 kDa immunoreactive mannoprotein mp88 n=1 Tax=Hesseltinella vesiculosa TaxID=101127 RepID=A0A1X2G7F2_9FUNG|nr:hypothetical protein DM01DRAFT_1368439 [Hesseltinella vesiculosa]
MQLALLVCVILAYLSTTLLALPIVRRGYTIQIKSSTEFCSFMPPQPGDDVGATEDQGIPMCTDPSLGSSTTFPQGFIQNATYRSTATYTQIRATIDISAYQLSPNDGGGQYDNRDISGVTCNGYKYFVNILEPDSGDFCIRCCKSQADCNIGQSTKGCDVVIPP